MIYVSRLTADQQVMHQIKPGQRAYLFVISGSLGINDQAMNSGDQARIKDETQLMMTAGADTELILLDLP